MRKRGARSSMKLNTKELRRLRRADLAIHRLRARP